MCVDERHRHRCEERIPCCQHCRDIVKQLGAPFIRSVRRVVLLLMLFYLWCARRWRNQTTRPQRLTDEETRQAKRKRTKLSGALRGPCAEVRGLGALGALEIVPPSKQSEGLTSAHVPAQLICEPGASALCSRFAARSSPSASSSSSPKAVRIVQPQPVHVVPNLWTCQWPWGTIEFVSAKAVSAHATETVKAGTRVLQNSCDIASAIVRLCARPSSTACRTRGMNC